MNDAVRTIKKNLPVGYERIISNAVGCSIATVNNVMNDRAASKRSSFKNKIMIEANRLAKENLESLQDIQETANALNKSNGIESEPAH
ncbi:MAG: hypothetical protein H6Q13_3164 [Bacteroidetes bacterium]|nr:hypothetical protein [Bacteroidota bacterium]